MAGLGRYYEFDLRCRGTPDPDTGYLVNIKDIDRAVRSGVVPELAKLCEERPAADPVTLVGPFRRLAADALARSAPTAEVVSLLWRLTPTYAVEARAPHEDHSDKDLSGKDLSGKDQPAKDQPEGAPVPDVIVKQQFDFAASHRLHVQTLSDDENRRTFGKCNNPSGHGHNYRVEIAARVPADGTGPSLAQIEPIVDETVIERFDHTYLNVDTEDFGDAGVNPSVEHIARRCHELLTPALAAVGAALETVTVWETDRTSATYPA
ncbi:MAG: 6-carboxytetrahydropterin synthase [Planctomycetota bacterium]